MVNQAAAYAKLLRLSNGPTAVADVWMGYAVANGELAPSWSLAFATLASLCLYHAGMIGNDIADVFDDRAEERDRPIASGEIPGWDAMRLRRQMEMAAIAFASVASWRTGSWWPVATSIALWNAVRWYNSPAKKTAAGPVLMGACRGLNVALGASLASLSPGSLVAPAGVATYVAGFTWFARDERSTPGRNHLVAGTMLSAFAVIALATWPFVLPDFSTLAPSPEHLVFWAVTLLFATRGMAAAIVQPTPKSIGRGVGIAIQGLIVIDATLATLYAGPMAGLAILALLPITMLLARSIPQT